MKFITDFTNTPIVHLYLPTKDLPGILYTHEVQNFARSAIFPDLQFHEIDGEFLDVKTLNLIEEHVIPVLDLTTCTSFPINKLDTIYLLPSHRGFGYLITSGIDGSPKALGWYGTMEGYVFSGASGIHPVIKVPFSLLESVDKVTMDEGTSNDAKSDKPEKDHTVEIHALETIAIYMEKNMASIKSQVESGNISTQFLSKLMASLKTTHEMSMGIMTKIFEDRREVRTRRDDDRTSEYLFDRMSFDQLQHIRSHPLRQRPDHNERSFTAEINIEWARSVLADPTSSLEERSLAEDVESSYENFLTQTNYIKPKGN